MNGFISEPNNYSFNLFVDRETPHGILRGDRRYDIMYEYEWLDPLNRQIGKC